MAYCDHYIDADLALEDTTGETVIRKDSTMQRLVVPVTHQSAFLPAELLSHVDAVKLKYEKPNGTTANIAGTLSHGYAYVELDSTIVAAAGVVRCQVIGSDDHDEILFVTPVFRLNILPNV